MVAMEHGKNVRAVERNMRKAIESAYEYDPQRVQSIFYYKVDKPYISEVLSMAVESIRHKQ
jgi:two-component system response regulator (stage 0 sporulation protein A)